MAAAKREAAALRAKGAELVIALAPVDKPLARRIARDAGVDLVVLGRQVGQGMERAEQVGQRVPGRGRRRAAAGRPHRHRLARQGPARRRAAGPRRRRCAGWRSTRPSRASTRSSRRGRPRRAAAIQAFIAAKRRERDALLAERGKLDAPWKAPATARYFTNRLIPLRRSLPRDEKVAARDAQARREDRGDQPQERQAAAAPPNRAGRSTSATPSARGCHKTAAGVLEEDRARAAPGRRWSTAASRTTTSASAATSPATARSAAPASATPTSCATCSARSATAPDRCTSPRRALEEPLAVHQADAGQHLHRLPHRAALGHVPVRGLPARHPRRRATAPQRAQEAGRRPDRARAAHARRWRARRPPARRRQEARRQRRQTPTAAPVSSWSSRSGSMLPPVMTTTVRRPRIALASSSSAASAGAADASHMMPERAVGVDDRLADLRAR